MTKILIVDEAELLLKMERSFLRRAGFDLLLTCDPRDLLEKARLFRPDLVLLHSGAHGGECGVPCAQRLKEDPETSRIPIILIRPAGAALPDPPPCERVIDAPLDRKLLIEAVSSLARVNHRTHKRVPASVPVEIRCGNEVRKGRTKDISAGGLFFLTGRPLEAGASVRVDLALPAPQESLTVPAAGVVVRGVPDDPSSYLIPGNGVRLLALEEKGRLALEEFVEGWEAGP